MHLIHLISLLAKTWLYLRVNVKAPTAALPLVQKIADQAKLQTQTKVMTNPLLPLNNHINPVMNRQ
jgi:hypothetical protein